MSERDGLFLHVNQDHNENTEYSSINVLEQRRPTYIENNSKKTQVPFFGPIRPISQVSSWEWRYLVLSLACVLIVLTMTIAEVLVYKIKTSDPDFIFAVLLIWTIIFCFFHVIQGILRERAFELLAFLVTLAVVLVYLIIKYFVQNELTLFEKIRLIIVCLLFPILIMDSMFLKNQYFKSKYLRYYSVGADARLQKMWNTFFAEESLLEFDFQIAISSSIILWMRKGMHQLVLSDWIVLIISGFVTATWFISGLIGMRSENKSLVHLFFITCVIDPALIIWNLIRYSDGPDNLELESSAYLSGILALIVRICTVVNMYFVFKNFNQGLKQLVFGPTTDRPELE